MIAVIRWTLWQRRWNILWWSLGIIVFIFINLIFYPTFRDQAAELQKSFDTLPDSAVQFLGGSTDFFSPVGYLNSQIYFITLPLILGILAISLGSNLLAKEEQDRTVDLLLAQPISRTSLLVGKVIAGIINLTFISLIALVVTLITVEAVNLDISIKWLVIVTAVCFLLTLSFAAVAFLISSSGRARVASLGITTVVALGGYIISSMAGTVDWLKGPAKIFPFHYYKSEEILNGTFHWSDVIFLISVMVVCGILSLILFRRRDIS